MGSLVLESGEAPRVRLGVLRVLVPQRLALLAGLAVARLDRVTQLVSDVPDGGVYSIAIPSIELHAGAYYLSVRCGANARAKLRLTQISSEPGMW